MPVESPAITDPPPGPLADYPTGTAYLRALRSGGSPRALWQVTPSAAPSGDWAAGLAVRRAGLRRRRPGCGDRGARPTRPGTTAGGLRGRPRPDRVRDAGGRGRAGRSVSGVSGCAPGRGRCGDRQSGGGVRAGGQARTAGSVGRRRRPARRAEVPVPALPRRPGAAGGRRRSRRPVRGLRPDRRAADLAGPGLAAGPRRGPDGRQAHRPTGQGDRRLRRFAGPGPGCPSRPAPARGVRVDARRAAPGARPRSGAEGRVSRGAGLPGVPRAGPMPVLWWAHPRRRARKSVGDVTGRLSVVRAAAGGLGVPDLRVATGPGSRRRCRADGRGAGEGLPADPDPPVGRRAAVDECPRHSRHRGGHPRRRASGYRRICGCGAVGHPAATAPAGSARRRGGAAALAQRRGPGPDGLRRRHGHCRWRERRAAAASSGPGRSRRVCGPGARRTRWTHGSHRRRSCCWSRVGPTVWRSSWP